MKYFTRAILVAAFSLASPYAFAGLPEFLIPVSDSEKDIALQRNDYFLKKNTYFAKRYRIVEVKTELLRSVERFNISLFDDVSVVAEVTKLDVRRDGSSIRWTGRVVEPAISIDDLRNEGLTKEEALFVLPQLQALRITAAEVTYDESTGTKYQYFYPKFSHYKVTDSAISGVESTVSRGRPPLFDVSMVLGASLPDGYRLRPLESDPRLHVLIQLDPDKSFSKGPVDDAENLKKPDEVAKRRQYREFMNSLGPDPRPADLHLE